MESKKVITLDDLHNNVELYTKQEEAMYLLNQPPPEAWVKEHPIVKGHKYLPIDKVEYLLRNVIREYRIEILRETVMFNGVSVSVRVHFKNLVTGEWDFHDGIAGEQLQTQKGKSAADLNNIKSGALSMALPIAKTNAIKDACDHFGNLFGANLNRKDVLAQSMRETPEEMLDRIKVLMFEPFFSEMPDEEQLNIERIVEQEDKVSYKKVLTLLLKHQKAFNLKNQ